MPVAWDATEEELANYQGVMERNSALTEKPIGAFCSRNGFPTVVISVSMNASLSKVRSQSASI